MARRLEGQVFLFCGNNGVTAIASERVVDDLERLNGHGGIIHSLDTFCNSAEARQALNRVFSHIGKPIFAFVSPERFTHQPWFTGSTLIWEALADYIEFEGGIIKGGGFYVPFSNGNEMGMHGLEAMENELRFVTTSQHFRETFGIEYGEVYRWRERTAAHANSES